MSNVVARGRRDEGKLLMAEMYADFKRLNELAQQIKSSFGVVTSTFQGQEEHRDPSTMTLGGPYSQLQESDLRSAEQVLYALGSAKRKASAAGSLKEYKFDEEIQGIIDAFKQGNEAISDVADFLLKLVELYETWEAGLVSWLGDYGMIPEFDKAWIEDRLDPIGGYVDERRGLGFALLGLADWKTLLATGEDGTVGIDACLFDATNSKMTRNEEGERVTDVAQVKILCLTAKAGVGEYKGGEAYGLDLGVNFMSIGGGRKKSTTSGVVTVSKGDGITFMHRVDKDGTTTDSIGIPDVPVSFEGHNVNWDRYFIIGGRRGVYH